MFSSKIMIIYRIVALLILSIPIAVNFLSKGDIVSSIIYVPLITLVLSGIAIFIDSKLAGLLNKPIQLPKLKAPTVDLQLKTTNDNINFNIN